MYIRTSRFGIVIKTGFPYDQKFKWKLEKDKNAVSNNKNYTVWDENTQKYSTSR